MLSSCFNEKVKEFIASDQALTFMNCIKGTPCFGYGETAKSPNFFMTLSSTDLKWNELISITNK